jgi:tRNA-specific 2-thiouridylase
MKRITIGLFSGGLDSYIAVHLIKDQGFKIICLVFDLWSFPHDYNKKHPLEEKVKKLGAVFKLIDLSDIFPDIISRPKWGYGKVVNPCIDCKYIMLKKAAEIMKKNSADFVFTGEVIGQRPMTQNKNVMNMLEKKCGLEGRLLRPLSAKLLKSTIPEKTGLVDRSKLLDIEGRSRHRQIELAKEYNLSDYASPAGGCILTQKEYGGRLQDLLSHKKNKNLTAEDLELLKIGRHFRISKTAKVIVGRNERENNLLENFIKNRIFLYSANFKGPAVLLEGTPSEYDINIAGAITARYGKGKQSDEVKIKIEGKSGEHIIEVKPISDSELNRHRISFNRAKMEPIKNKKNT